LWRRLARIRTWLSCGFASISSQTPPSSSERGRFDPHPLQAQAGGGDVSGAAGVGGDASDATRGDRDVLGTRPCCRVASLWCSMPQGHGLHDSSAHDWADGQQRLGRVRAGRTQSSPPSARDCRCSVGLNRVLSTALPADDGGQGSRHDPC
jgi:hypothetical protein